MDEFIERNMSIKTPIKKTHFFFFCQIRCKFDAHFFWDSNLLIISLIRAFFYLSSVVVWMTHFVPVIEISVVFKRKTTALLMLGHKGHMPRLRLLSLSRNNIMKEKNFKNISAIAKIKFINFWKSILNKNTFLWLLN